MEARASWRKVTDGSTTDFLLYLHVAPEMQLGEPLQNVHTGEVCCSFSPGTVVGSPCSLSFLQQQGEVRWGAGVALGEGEEGFSSTFFRLGSLQGLGVGLAECGACESLPRSRGWASGNGPAPSSPFSSFAFGTFHRCALVLRLERQESRV